MEQVGVLQWHEEQEKEEIAYEDWSLRQAQYLTVSDSQPNDLSYITMIILGCMAERLKTKILDRGKLVDVIAGPDSYKDLPRLLAVTDNETAINVVLSFDETYADVMPVRLNQDSIGAYM